MSVFVFACTWLQQLELVQMRLEEQRCFDFTSQINVVPNIDVSLSAACLTLEYLSTVFQKFCGSPLTHTVSL